ncbi:DNA internalization-related competence protein ComEC/Rec2 [Variovorax dokdonensis]|uniref:DNA internalization-related competence protein ComEC/Rec2 n=1 Tax=Variovorax dokdonensis TaxID=344883 RepID=A0ABT7NDY0_9BURK|nr:DNA internalization-related competence protein ComEC/Rec2 [Variovorax dokdonensis]MDM0046155.1 DNA internalization-related competence protein ComEC/Rec2 [Variovorax dokdonensis]
MRDRHAARAAWPFVGLGGFVAGSALQLQQAALWHWAAYVALVLAGATCIGTVIRARRLATRRAWLVALIGGAALGAGLAGVRGCAFVATALDPALQGRDLLLTGVVVQMPTPFEGGLRFRLDVDDGPAGVPPRIALSWYASQDRRWGSDEEAAPTGMAAAPPVDMPRAGERWRLPVRLKAPHGSFNPYGFDVELWAWVQGLQASGYVRSAAGAAPERLSSAGWSHPVEQAREHVRDAIAARVSDARMAGVLSALAVGDQAAIDRADWDLFRATGVAHLMSISGLHVTLFAWMAGGAVGWLWRRSRRLMLRWPAQHAAAFGGVVLAAAYALFSGWGVPSQRTVCMLAVMALLRGSGLRWPWPMAWLLTCATVVALDPWALTQAGFWLSFVAVGVLFAADAGKSRDTRSAWWTAPLRLLREQASVTLALTPLTLLLFQQASLVGLLANLVSIPWVTLGVLPLALLGVAAPPLWSIAAWSLQGLMSLLEVLAAWPMAQVGMAAPPLWAAAAGVAGGLVLAMRWPWPMRLLGLPLLLPALLWQPSRPEPGGFEVLAADVGQGSAILVRTAGHSLLFDAGPRFGLTGQDAGQQVLVPLLRALGDSPDLVVLSHSDLDHIGGAPALMRALPQARWMGSLPEGHALRTGRPFTPCVAERGWMWDGVRFEILHPLEPPEATPRTRPNGQSCVLRIVAADGAAALLTGDIESAQEAELLRRVGPQGLRADLLLAPHHGSRTSSSPPFVAAVDPSIVVFQAGYRNRFGHPAAAVRARYVHAGVQTLDSPGCGALHWRSLDPGAWTCERQARGRYWNHEARQTAAEP